MRGLRRPLGIVAATAFVMLAAAGCAGAGPGATPAPAAFGTVAPVPPEDEVGAVGTVLDVGGDVQLCLGAVAESYPPQCTGLPVEGWTWDGVDGSETSGDTRWGAYAVRGTYDGATFTMTNTPVMLALYDPIAPVDPTGGEPGAGDDATLARLQDEMPDRLGDAYLGSFPQDGWLWVDVVWDDGSLQEAADAEFGDDVVVVRSALHLTGS